MKELDKGAKKPINKVEVVFTPEEFKEKGFAGEIAKYMRENPNTAIVGNELGVDRHVIKFSSREAWNLYKNPYTVK